MDGFIDFDKAVEAEASQGLKRIENLSGMSALVILSAATWLAWPAFNAAMNGGSLLSGMGYSLIVLAWVENRCSINYCILADSGFSRFGIIFSTRPTNRCEPIGYRCILPL